MGQSKSITIFSSLAMGLLILVSAQGNDEIFKPDRLYQDNQSCPFECCSLGNWQATGVSQLLAQPSKSAQPVTKLKVGDSVKAVAGQTQVKPVLLQVLSKHGEFAPGDKIWLLNYLGEGEYYAWKDGNKVAVTLPFSPYQAMVKCDDPALGRELDVWACLTEDYQADWWVKVELEHNGSGWLLNPVDFAGMDSCS